MIDLMPWRAGQIDLYESRSIDPWWGRLTNALSSHLIVSELP
jgi:hypothetical protein